jgi:branched-chain amino acid transport system ATP-binding protein
MLKVEDLDVHYGDLQVLWGVSLEVRDGEIVALIGSNGAGKSTVIKAMTGLLRPTKGSIRLNDLVLDRLPAHKIVEQGVSMVPEGRRLFPKMTVLQNLKMGAFVKRARNEIDQSLGWIYEVFPVLKERSAQPAGLLSGGEQQMLAIARALMTRNKFLLLDEMSLGLSPLLVQNLFKIISQINKAGISVLIVEQNVPMTLRLADRAYIIESGRIVGEGDAKSLMDSPKVREAYLGMAADCESPSEGR